MKSHTSLFGAVVCLRKTLRIAVGSLLCNDSATTKRYSRRAKVESSVSRLRYCQISHVPHRESPLCRLVSTSNIKTTIRHGTKERTANNHHWNRHYGPAVLLLRIWAVDIMLVKRGDAGGSSGGGGGPPRFLFPLLLNEPTLASIAYESNHKCWRRGRGVVGGLASGDGLPPIYHVRACFEELPGRVGGSRFHVENSIRDQLLFADYFRQTVQRLFQ
ncbi:hypothetical protein OUZ56_031878 [Daphnia magna]|uniref:Uncharacterized protein n=1 Tax=Daphnia magna TaxID=35525 RepID=A0ABQ9ZVK3_9CRUS|nr:hypothetical protein OUZ56_031878 [Daphnia magna]